MLDQKLIEFIRKENYALRLFRAYNNSHSIISITTDLIKEVKEVFRYVEPSQFQGELLVFRNISNESEIIEKLDENLIYYKDSLTTIIDGNYAIELCEDGRLYLWKDIDVNNLLSNEDILFYHYSNDKEFFSINNNKIDILHYFRCSSIYALHYKALWDALESYKIDKIRKSSCSEFAKCWNDDNRMFFKPGPEDTMQVSLEQHLKSCLREVDIVREYNLGASKPVDIRVSWKEASKAALIELKWIGKSKNSAGNLITYTDSRANDGAVQIKEYLDLDDVDTPTSVTKGVLVIVDGRRRGTNKNTSTINRTQGFYYSEKEIVFKEENKFNETLINFEKPLRMFTEPICI